MALTEKQLSTLRHMLGINDPSIGHPKPYRNYAAVNPGDPEYLELERLGMVENYGRGIGSYDYYRCTDAGRAAAFESHRQVRLPKSKRVYAAFLHISDCIPDLKFGDFIKDPQFAETRRNA